MLGETRIDALVRVDGILDSALQAACANAGRDALLHRPLAPLYTQDFGPSGDPHGRLAVAGPLGKMDQDAEGRGEAVARVGYGARVVSDEAAQLARARLRLGIDLEADGGRVAESWGRSG